MSLYFQSVGLWLKLFASIPAFDQLNYKTTHSGPMRARTKDQLIRASYPSLWFLQEGDTSCSAPLPRIQQLQQISAQFSIFEQNSANTSMAPRPPRPTTTMESRNAAHNKATHATKVPPVAAGETLKRPCPSSRSTMYWSHLHIGLMDNVRKNLSLRQILDMDGKFESGGAPECSVLTSPQLLSGLYSGLSCWLQ